MSGKTASSELITTPLKVVLEGRLSRFNFEQSQRIVTKTINDLTTSLIQAETSVYRRYFQANFALLLLLTIIVPVILINLENWL